MTCMMNNVAFMYDSWKQDMVQTQDDFIHIWLHEYSSNLELWWRFMLNLTDDSCSLENVGRLVTPAKKLEDTIRLAELVIEVLQQNEEHHAEVRTATLLSTVGVA